MRRRLLILGYHGFQIADEAAFRPSLFLRKEIFQQRLHALEHGGFAVISLEQAVAGLGQDTLPDNAVVITIDDGFLSVLSQAAPVLSSFNYPATLYATTYYVDKPTPIFRLVIQYLFWKSTLSELTTLDASWASALPVDLTDPAARDQTIWSIIEYGEQECTEAQRAELSREVAAQLNVAHEPILESRCLSLLDPQELALLGDHGIDVQLHTHRHVFPAEDAARAKQELSENRDFLTAQTGKRPTHFCYPSGVWSQDGFEILEATDVDSATTCQAGLNPTDTHPLALYRILDRDDLTQVEFEAELYGFAELLRIFRGQKRSVHKQHRRG